MTQCLRSSAAPIEVCPSSSQEEEQRRTEVGNPASEEQAVIGELQVFGRKRNVGEEVSCVVDRHNDHHESAHDVERRQACGARGGDAGNASRRGKCGGCHRSHPLKLEVYTRCSRLLHYLAAAGFRRVTLRNGSKIVEWLNRKLCSRRRRGRVHSRRDHPGRGESPFGPGKGSSSARTGSDLRSFRTACSG